MGGEEQTIQFSLEAGVPPSGGASFSGAINYVSKSQNITLETRKEGITLRLCLD